MHFFKTKLQSTAPSCVFGSASLVVGRMTSGDGAADVVVLHGEHQSPLALSFRRPQSPPVMDEYSLSLSLM